MNDEPKPELLSCPFCGGEARIYGLDSVGCKKCGAGWHFCDTKAQAATLWNTRHDYELVEALKLCRAKFKEGEGVEEWLCPDFTTEITAIDNAINNARKVKG